MTKPTELTFAQGDEEWKRLRYLATVPEPGTRSALWFLVAKVLGLEDLIPMRYESHWALCLFAERATGIPAIDNARVQLIQTPRGVGKSAIVTKGRALQRLLRHDGWSICIANETQRLAKAFLNDIKLEFEQNDFMRALFPERIPADFKKTIWSAEQIVVQRKKPRATGPSVLAAGVDTAITGIHVDEFIIDDPISEEAAENALRGSFTEIEKTNRWMHHVEPLLCYPKRDPITVIGTPWWYGDTYDYIEGDDKEPGLWGHGEPLVKYPWTLTLPNGEHQTVTLLRRGELAIFRRPARDERGESAYPERWTTDDLDQMERQEPEFFAANYLLNPTAGGATTFDLNWLKHYELDGPQTHIHYRDQLGSRHTLRIRDLVVLISVDPAFADRQSSARTAIPVVGMGDTELFLLEDFAERGMGAHDIANKLAEFAARYHPQTIFLETIVAQRALLDPIKSKLADLRIPPTTIIEIPSHGKMAKDMRIYGLEPWFKSGQFHVHMRHQKFKHEYSTFPRGNLKDILDALAFQRESWERMSGSVAKTKPQWKDKERAARDRIRRSVGPYGGY